MTSITRTPGRLSRHAGALGAGIVVLLGIIWMVTYGSFELFDAEHFGQFYDAQAASLLNGHWNVPPDAIFPEGFYHDGKAYGYFGFVPSIPRIGLNDLFPAMAGSWSRLSVILGCAVTLGCCYSLLMRARKWMLPHAPWTRVDMIAYAGFILLAGLGSSMTYIGSRAFIYHEAIIWAVALALACYDQLLAYLLAGRWTNLLAGCVLAFFSFFTRISSGCGPCLALLLLALNLISWRAVRLPGGAIFRRLATWTPRPSVFPLPEGVREPSAIALPSPISHPAIIAVMLIAIVTTYAAINHAKFGMYLQPAPMELHEQITSDPARYAKTNGQWMLLGNVPTVTYAYLSPGSIIFERIFPWVFLQRDLRLLPDQHLDGWGQFASVTTSMPVFLVLAIVGIGVVVAGRRTELVSSSIAASSPAILFLGSVGGILPILAFCCIDNRYLHEFFPFLMIASAFGMNKLLALRRQRLRIFLLVAIFVVGSVEIYANCAFALVYQRLAVFDRPYGPELQMRHWQKVIDEQLNG